MERSKSHGEMKCSCFWKVISEKRFYVLTAMNDKKDMEQSEHDEKSFENFCDYAENVAEIDYGGTQTFFVEKNSLVDRYY